MAKGFLIGDVISRGWSTMKANFPLFLGVLLILFAINVLPELFKHTELSFLVSIVTFLALLILQIGVYRITLNIADDKETDVGDLFSQTSLFPDYLVGSILYFLIVLGGTLLLIVPGIIWALKYQFYGYFIVDQKLSPTQALKRSGEITYGHKWRLFGLFWTIVGINILGAMALLVGLFTTIPTSMMATTYVYRDLAGNAAAAKRNKKDTTTKTAAKTGNAAKTKKKKR